MTDWMAALLGGVLIGASALIMMGLLGRITGISGILAGITQPSPPEAPGRNWQWFFVIGLAAGSFIFHAVSGMNMPAPPSGNGLSAIIAGLLVGFGTRLGSGCTSGHGICGISRFSPRSILATVVFCSTGILTVTLSRHVI